MTDTKAIEMTGINSFMKHGPLMTEPLENKLDRVVKILRPLEVTKLETVDGDMVKIECKHGTGKESFYLRTDLSVALFEDEYFDMSKLLHELFIEAIVSEIEDDIDIWRREALCTCLLDVLGYWIK